MVEVTITYLEMLAETELRPRDSADPRLAIREATNRQWQVNRFLYQLVGGPWSWTDKLSWTNAQWENYVRSEHLRTFLACYDDSLAGYYELSHDAADDVEIAYFGLVPQFVGKGIGGALLTHALRRAWAWPARRVWCHTCSLDHPAALPNYQARGMKVYHSRIRKYLALRLDALERPLPSTERS